MEPNNGVKKSTSELFRWITPVMLTVSIAILTSMNNTVNKIDDKMFRHLTNDEIHVSRSTIVDKNTFDMTEKFRDNQMARIDQNISEIKDLMRTKK